MIATPETPRLSLVASPIPMPADMPDYPSIIHALQVAVDRAPDRVAKICIDQQVTYRQYARAVAGLGRHLMGLGSRGQRVALVMYNSIEASVASLGIIAGRGQACLVNPSFPEPEMAQVLKEIDPMAIICDPALLERVQGAAEGLGVRHIMALGPGGDMEIGQWADDEALELGEDQFPQADELGLMIFTGGTTGVPKGANHTNHMLVSFCRQKTPTIGYDFDTEIMLSVAPMFHIFGHHYANLLPVFLRGTLVMVPRYKPEIILEQLEKHRCTVFSGGPAAIYQGIITRPEMETTDFSSLRYSLSGGAPCPEPLIRGWKEKTGSIFLEGYGMTEGSPITNNPADGVHKIGSAGVPVPLTDICIVDIETGNEIIPWGQSGEICYRGPQVMPGYHNRPKESAEALRNGWMHTGDIGYLDEDGYVIINDRKKDMILVGGYNVYPREIDQVLFSHPDIQDAIAVGVPEEFRGEVVKAFIVKKPGCTLSEEQVIEFCEQHLVKYKVPKMVQFMESLPKTEANKVSRALLRKLHEEQQKVS